MAALLLVFTQLDPTTSIHHEQSQRKGRTAAHTISSIMSQLRKLLAEAELGVTRRIEEELTATRTEKATKVKSEAKVGGTSPERRGRGEKPMAKLECE